MTSSLETIRAELRAAAKPEDAIFLQRYFKTGPGEYAEGDQFIGVRVPQIRTVAKRNRSLPLEELAALLASPVHEDRLLALLIMVAQYAKGDSEPREQIYRLYLDNTALVNNWDLVDSSAVIVGWHVEDGDRGILERLARSPRLWDRRIAMLATQCHIRKGALDTAIHVAEILVHDPHDLIHKAVGWMLREVGQRDRHVEEAFLRRHLATMPRTMLRYAIEKFPPDLRQQYLRGQLRNPVAAASRSS